MPRRINVIEKIILKESLVIKRCTLIPPSFLPLLNNVIFGKNSELIKEERFGKTYFVVLQSCVGGLYFRKLTDEDTFKFIWNEALKNGNKILK